MVQERKKGDPFPTTETRNILKDVRIVLKDIHPTILEFCRYLGEHLPSHITAEEFVTYTMGAIRNLEEGKDPSGAPLDHVLTEQERVVYVALHIEMHRIVAAIFPKKFGAEVEEALKQYHDD